VWRGIHLEGVTFRCFATLSLEPHLGSLAHCRPAVQRFADHRTGVGGEDVVLSHMSAGGVSKECYSYSMMSRLPSRATLILNGAGVTVTQVAESAGIAQPSVSAQLAGRRLLQDKTLDAIRRAVGRAVADEVQSVVADARSAYLFEVQAGRM